MKYYYVETWERIDNFVTRQYLFTATNETISKVRINKTTIITEITHAKYIWLSFVRMGGFKEYEHFLKWYTPESIIKNYKRAINHYEKEIEEMKNYIAKYENNML